MDRIVSGAILNLRRAVRRWRHFGLTVASESLIKKVILSEIDAGVAAVWSTIFRGRADDISWLCERISRFEATLENVRAVLDTRPKNLREAAFKTIIRNRMQRGGVIARGAGLLKQGEGGKGLKSRWYPDTLVRRIETLRGIRGRITFERADAFDIIRRYADDPHAAFFLDPPYTAGGKNAGRRLYAHSKVDHEALFYLAASVKGSVLMTYDDAPEVRALAVRYGFQVREVPMKTTHHRVQIELLLLKP